MLLIASNFVEGQEKKFITGFVRDSLGAAIQGASISTMSSKAIALTDENSFFKIQTARGEMLTVKAVGYASFSIKIGNEKELTIILAATYGVLEDVVVTTSMGIKKQAKSLGYAVSTINAKEITESGSPNFAAALYGKAAGVKVVNAHGGASSAVSIQIRGVSSIGLNTQPLYIVDGVPIRLYNDLMGNYSNNSNNNGYWSNQRIQSNGILDINPEDIDNITILKGASASALYGSEATNGVVVITTKKGKKDKALGIEFNLLGSMEMLASSPDYQNEYGPGYDAQTNVQNGIATHEGWSIADSFHHPSWGSYAQFGPKFDGSLVRYWDGTTRKYLPQINNYRDFFTTGYGATTNIAISNATDNMNYRLSYTHVDYSGIVPGGNLYKNNFNFNGTLTLNNKISVDLISTYNNNFTHNRTYLMSQLLSSYGGYFSRADDMNTFFSRYKTTDGYKYVSRNNNAYDQDQKLVYNFRAMNLMDYLWTQLRNSYDETQNRFMNSATLNIGLTHNLKLRGRIGNDITELGVIEKDYNSQPAGTGYSGGYNVTNNTFNIFYGDGLVFYQPKISKQWGLHLTGGFTARKEVYNYLNAGTTNGLMQENFFSFSNSAGNLSGRSYRQEQMDVAGFGIADFNYKDLFFIEGTERYESTSTLPVKNNSYWYPSFNASFILSDAVDLLPKNRSIIN